MGKTRGFLLMTICLLLMSACSLRGDAADMYKQEAPLQVDIGLPEVLSADEEVYVEAILRQNGKLVEQADFVHFEIWNHDGSVPYPMQEAIEKAGGVYQLPVQFESDGLYYLEVHAGNDGSLISPQLQFVVGELSENEMESLKEGPSPEAVPADAHH